MDENYLRPPYICKYKFLDGFFENVRQQFNQNINFREANYSLTVKYLFMR